MFLNGQQRLSAIYATFCKDRNEAPENNIYNIDPHIFDIYFDLIEKKFISIEDIKKYSYFIDEKSIINQRFSKSNPFTRSFLLLMAQKKPLNLVNGNIIDLGIALSKYNLKEYHHIFPRAFLKKKSVETSKINSICNFCFLPADSNKKISNKSPSEYIFTIVPSSDYSKILESNLMPLKKEIFSKNQYESFLNLRAQIILQYLDQLIEC